MVASGVNCFLRTHNHVSQNKYGRSEVTSVGIQRHLAYRHLTWSVKRRIFTGVIHCFSSKRGKSRRGEKDRKKTEKNRRGKHTKTQGKLKARRKGEKEGAKEEGKEKRIVSSYFISLHLCMSKVPLIGIHVEMLEVKTRQKRAQSREVPQRLIRNIQPRHLAGWVPKVSRGSTSALCCTSLMLRKEAPSLFSWKEVVSKT